MALCLTSCFMHKSGYDNYENYSTGNTTFNDKINNIDISWVSGKVKIINHQSNTITLTEKSNYSLPEKKQVHWWLDGTTLRVKFASSKAVFFPLGTSKELTIALPENYSLSNLSINSTSADISIEKMKTEKLDISSVSGAIDLMGEAKEMMLKSTSGNIDVNQAGITETANISTTSGALTTSFDVCKKISINSTSGKINVTTNETIEALAKSTSGSISFKANRTFNMCNFKSTSGCISLGLNNNIGFVATINTSSGDFTSDFALKKRDNTYTYGNGDATISAKTTSGNIILNGI